MRSPKITQPASYDVSYHQNPKEDEKIEKYIQNIAEELKKELKVTIDGNYIISPESVQKFLINRN